MKNVLVYGAYDLDNLGDDYMMYEINKKLVSKNVNPIYIKVKNRNNYFEVNKYDVIDIFYGKNKPKKIINYIKNLFPNSFIKNIDALIFMGGGYTNEDFGLKNLFKIYLTILLFKVQKKKVFFTGQTVGPYKTWQAKILLKKIYNAADKIFVREEYSKELLKTEFNIESFLSGDDAYLTVENNNDNKNSKLHKEDYIIYNYKDFKEYEQYKEKYFNFLLDIALKTKYRIKVIPFRSDEKNKEYKINYELYEYLRNNNIDVEFIVERNLNKFQDIFKSSKFVIGTAYHSIVLGLIFNCIPYSAYCGEYYKIKINGILRWYNYNDKNCIDISHINDVENRLELTNNAESLDKQIKITKEISENVSKAWDNIINEI